ncbi:MAG: hypothetical protein QE271_12780 [Bacteriovoracaceae bacterium]|nr:hypothetical protein [Bacteriovoracaceae bacterium]
MESVTIPQLINPVIEKFYRKCQDDFLIGYYFQRQLHFFDQILPQLKIFWLCDLEKQLGFAISLSTKQFNLNQAHQNLKLKRGEIGRWAVLFLETLNEEKARLPHSLVIAWEKRIVFYRNLFWKKFSSAK